LNGLIIADIFFIQIPAFNIQTCTEIGVNIITPTQTICLIHPIRKEA